MTIKHFSLAVETDVATTQRRHVNAMLGGVALIVALNARKATTCHARGHRTVYVIKLQVLVLVAHIWQPQTAAFVKMDMGLILQRDLVSHAPLGPPLLGVSCVLRAPQIMWPLQDLLCALYVQVLRDSFQTASTQAVFHVLLASTSQQTTPASTALTTSTPLPPPTSSVHSVLPTKLRFLDRLHARIALLQPCRIPEVRVSPSIAPDVRVSKFAN
jgi:hypothetical protein